MLKDGQHDGSKAGCLLSVIPTCLPQVRLFFDSRPPGQTGHLDKAIRESTRGDLDPDERDGDTITAALQQVEEEQTANIVQLCRC